MAQGIATRSSRAHRTICLPIKEEDYLRVKSGVSSSFLSGKFGEIRCQFIILARKDELTPRGSTPRGSDTEGLPIQSGSKICWSRPLSADIAGLPEKRDNQQSSSLFLPSKAYLTQGHHT